MVVAQQSQLEVKTITNETNNKKRNNNKQPGWFSFPGRCRQNVFYIMDLVRTFSTSISIKSLYQFNDKPDLDYISEREMTFQHPG